MAYDTYQNMYNLHKIIDDHGHVSLFPYLN